MCDGARELIKLCVEQAEYEVYLKEEDAKRKALEEEALKTAGEQKTNKQTKIAFTIFLYCTNLNSKYMYLLQWTLYWFAPIHIFSWVEQQGFLENWIFWLLKLLKITLDFPCLLRPT